MYVHNIFGRIQDSHVLINRKFAARLHSCPAQKGLQNKMLELAVHNIFGRIQDSHVLINRLFAARLHSYPAQKGLQNKMLERAVAFAGTGN